MSLGDIIFYSVGIITILGAIAHTIIELVREWRENKR